MRAWARLGILGALGGVGIACGANNAASDSGFAAPRAYGDMDASVGGGENGGTLGATPGASGDAGLPPETKSEGAYRSPVATGHFVWIANPDSGRVAYIDAASLEVTTVEAGDGPTYLAAVPDPTADVAIVINVRSHDATLLRQSNGLLSTSSFPVTSDANSWAVSSSGRWAVAWTDATSIADPDPTQGFQDIAVLDLSGARAPIVVAVGYRPSKVAFSADGSRAFAVTQDGISVVDLLGGSQPAVVASYPMFDAKATDAGAPPNTVTPDVSFTPDGSYALVREDGVPTISVVALSNGAITDVALPTAPTDLVLSPKGDFALAVLRDSSSIAELPIPAIASSPTSFQTIAVTGHTVGRAILTSDASSALLFTTAAPVDELVLLTLGASPTTRTIPLHAPVHAVFPSPDGTSAVVLHEVTDATAVKGAFSVVPVASPLPAKIVGTPAPPTAVALSPASDRAVVSIRDDSSLKYGFYLARMPSLEVDTYALASPPIAVGIAAAASRAYVAQDYDEGRITMCDLGTGQARTVTGFELGARVVDGSQP
jgi:hypothetical protein